MRKTKRVISFMMVFFMVILMYPVNGLAATTNFNSYEVDKLRTFLDYPSDTVDKSNGQMINGAYNPNDPTTWSGVVWNDTDPRQVIELGSGESWCGKTLKGSLNVNGFTLLESINIQDNQINGIDVSGNNDLINLFCQDNEISSLNIKGLSNLQRLICYNNKLDSLDTTGDDSLYEIHMANNRFWYVDLSNLKNLRYLLCYDNPLKDLRFNLNDKAYSFSAYGDGYVNYVNSEHYYVNEEINHAAYATPMGDVSFNLWVIDDSIVNRQSMLDLHNINYSRFEAYFGGCEVQPLIHNVTFEVNGGACIDGRLNQEVVDGGSAIAPVVERSGYDFGGWDTSLVNIISDVTIKAIWNPIPSGGPSISTVPTPSVMPTISLAPTPVLPDNTVKPSFAVTFDLNGGTQSGGGALTQDVIYGTSPVEPITSRDGYDFKGWDTNFVFIYRSIVVKAIWEKIIYHTVNFDLDGGTHTGGGELTQNVREGRGAIEPLTVRDGYTFEEWDYDLYNVMSDLFITASWIKNDTGIPEEPDKDNIDNNTNTEPIDEIIPDDDTPEIKPETKPETKPENEPETKPETIPEIKPETNIDIIELPKTGDNDTWLYLGLISMLLGGTFVVIELRYKRKERIQ